MDIDKHYLITGGAGFLGNALIEILVNGGFRHITVIGRNEGSLVRLKEKFPIVNIVVGDISDEYDCARACHNIDGIFHLAAMKHVGLAENNVSECINSNIVGTMNILTNSYGKDFVIFISSDKAARVNGVYGATKFLGERLFSEWSKLNPKTKYRVVRYGNVLYSTGSVLCLWKDKLQHGEDIKMTDPNATRFFWTVDEAVDLIFECLNRATNANPYHCAMKSIRMGDLLEAMIQKYSKKRPKITITGLGPGENLHEIVADDLPDSSIAEKYTVKEILEII